MSVCSRHSLVTPIDWKLAKAGCSHVELCHDVAILW